MAKPPLLAAILLALTACVSVTRNPAPPTLTGGVRPLGLPSEMRALGLDRERVEMRSASLIAQLKRTSADGTIDVLALSGGGAGGAFGAGVLVGLTRSGHRPEFEIVTGVSAGAIVAPFAFLGPSWDAKLTETLAGAGTSGILVRRSFDLLFRPSLYRGRPLARFVERAMTDDLIDAVARESARGRVLLVATTDLDKEATVIWNLGAIAQQGTPEARRLFRKVLVASASIPGVFPPVLIDSSDDGHRYHEMHVDGGTTVAFFVAPEVMHVLPGTFGIEGANLYVVMNAQNVGIPETTDARLAPILARSSSAALNQMARSQLQLTSAFAREQRMSFQFTEIPADYPYRGSMDFRPDAMRKLFDYGADCAARGLIWTNLPDALHRTEDALRRLESDPKGSAKVPCPAEIH